MTIIEKVRRSVRCCLERTAAGGAFCNWYRNRREKRHKKVACARLRKYGVEILDLIAKALTDLNVPYFADYGTLLGIIREAGFIRHDNDLDFGVMPGFSKKKEMLMALLSVGFTFKRAFEFNGKITEISLIYKDVPVDFFFNEETEKGEEMWAYTYSTGGYIPKPQERFPVLASYRDCRPRVSALVNAEIYGRRVPIPEDAEKLIAITYGNDWRIPKSAWTPNVTSNQPSLRLVYGEAYVIGENCIK